MSTITVRLSREVAAALLVELIGGGEAQADLETPFHGRHVQDGVRALAFALEVDASAPEPAPDKPKRGRPVGSRTRKPRPVQVTMPSGQVRELLDAKGKPVDFEEDGK